jgi:flagellar hook-associated protein 3 FlgL
MRVTNDTLRQAFLNALGGAQQRIQQTQAQIASGQRVNSPSDDPVAAARIAHIEVSLARLDQYQANGVFARNQLGLEEEALGQVIDNLQRVRELTLQANNATASDADRAIAAGELRQYRNSLLALANSTDVDGRYLFGGYNETTQPFASSAGGAVVYNGDQGQRTLQVGDSRFVAINDSGTKVFQAIPSGNGTFALATSGSNTGTAKLGAGTVVDASAWVRDTYTISFATATTFEVRDGANALVASGPFTPPQQSIGFRGIDVPIEGVPAAGDSFTVTPSSSRDAFTTLDSLIATLGAPAGTPAGRAQLHSNIGQRLVDLDAALAHMIDMRADIGARVRALDHEEALSADYAVHLTSTLSSVRDLDYAAAISKLSQELFGLEAAQRAFARTEDLSLFRYL